MAAASRPGTKRVVSLQQVTRKVAWVAMAASAALVAAACSSSGSNSPGGGSSSGVTVPQISASDFNNSFSAMSQLKPLAKIGKGNVAVILPDTVSSARYVEFDAPYLTESLTKAGLSKSQFTVQNAGGSDATELTDAQTAITKGASVLIMDPLDSTVGAAIEKYAASHGAAVIDYDRLTLGGSRKYYVSFNNVLVGTKIGQGMVSCVADWKVKNPNVLVMYGDPTDNNATLFGQGYDAVLKPIYLEAQAAAALAMYVRAGVQVPTALTGGQTTMDTTGHVSVPSVLLTPTWVTTSNMNSTVIADKFVPASQLCTAKYKAACTAAGISG